MAFDISIVTLGVDDLDRAFEFYASLDLPLQDREPDDAIAFVTLDGAWLALYPRELLADDATVDPAGEGFAGITQAHTVDSEAAVDERIEAAGAEVVKPPQRADWGGYSGSFADPNGHLWEVASTPFFDVA